MNDLSASSQITYRAVLVEPGVVRRIRGLSDKSLAWLFITPTIVLLLVFLSCAGVTYPNAAAIAMAPFTRNAGSASAMLGFLQLGVGAVASAGVGLLNSRTSVPIVSLMSGTTLIGLAILLFGQGRVARARHRIS